MLDRVAESFGQKCYEVPVGFKYIPAKMMETNAVIGGESSGGLTVRGHIPGKDGIYTTSLLIEMIAVLGKKLSQILSDIKEIYGDLTMEERDYPLSEQKRDRIYQRLLIDKLIPKLPFEIEKISYLDGCKIYFRNGGWVITRFSGTEPLLRIFCEIPNAEDAKLICETYETFLSL